MKFSPPRKREGHPQAFIGRRYSRASLIVAIVFLLSVAMRIALASQGGQYFYPDEHRYDRAVHMYQALQSGAFQKAKFISMLPDHMLFSWLCAAITSVHHAIADLAGKDDWISYPENLASTIWIGAAALSMFSAVNVLLVYKIARRLGASGYEALWSMLLMSVAQTTCYHSRHLVPYESALCVALLAWYIGISAKDTWRIFIGGLLAGLSYGLYNGYWFLVPVIWLGLLASNFKSLPLARLVVAASCGTIVGIGAPVLYGWLMGGQTYIAILVDFSQSVTQGAFSEGWYLPWEYLWHMEGLVGAAVGLAIAAAIAMAWKRGMLELRVRVVLVMLLVSYGLLVLFSNGLQVFVVYARTVKPLIPLLCLLGGWALTRLFPNRITIQVAVGCALLAHGILQFSSNFYRVFPREVEQAVMREWGNPYRTVSLEGPTVEHTKLPVSRPDLVLVNAQPLYPVLGNRGYPVGRVLLRIPHPLQSPAYQYDGTNAKERAVLRASDFSVQLIGLHTIPGSR